MSKDRQVCQLEVGYYGDRRPCQRTARFRVEEPGVTVNEKPVTLLACENHAKLYHTKEELRP